MVNHYHSFYNPAASSGLRYRTFCSHALFNLIINKNLPNRLQRIVQHIESEPSSVNHQIYHVTPLYIACRASRTIGSDVVRILLEFGAKLSDKYKYNALYAACRHSSTDSSTTSVELLLRYFQPTMQAAMFVVANGLDSNLYTLDVLIQAGLDINSVNDIGNTLLHACLKHRYSLAMVIYLIENGIDIHARNYEGETALILAATCPEATMLLLDYGADVSSSDMYDKTALVAAALVSRFQVVSILLKSADINQPDPDGFTVLMKIVRYSWDCLMINFLIANGADIVAKSTTGKTALHIACRYRGGNQVSPLLAANADVNAADSDGITPLMESVTGNAFHVAELLIKHGANVDAQNRYGETALHLVCKTCTGNAAWYFASILSATNVNLVDRDGNTPLFLLAIHQESAVAAGKLLLELGADPAHRNNAADTVRVGRHRVRLTKHTRLFREI